MLCRDDLQAYGFRREGLVESLALSAPPVVVIVVPRILHGGFGYGSFNLSFPYNIWYATLGAIAYGPLEVFFVIWLIINTGSCCTCPFQGVCGVCKARAHAYLGDITGPDSGCIRNYRVWKTLDTTITDAHSHAIEDYNL